SHAQPDLREASTRLREVRSVGPHAAGEDDAEAAPDGDVGLAEQPSPRAADLAAETLAARQPEADRAEPVPRVHLAVRVAALEGVLGARPRRCVRVQRAGGPRLPAMEPRGPHLEPERGQAAAEHERDGLPRPLPEPRAD